MESTLIHHMGYIKAHFSINGKRIYHSTNVKIDKAFVDSNGFVKPKSHLNWQDLNRQALLEKKRLDAAILKDLDTHGNFDIDRIRILVREPEQKEVQNKSTCCVHNLIDSYINSNPEQLARSSQFFHRLLQIVNKNIRKCNEIDSHYLRSILFELCEGVNANTASNRLKLLKRCFTWGKVSGYQIPQINLNKLIKKSFKPDFVWLTNTKIDQLIAYQPKSKTEAKVKTTFLLLIYTGMRYSDYLNLSTTDIHDGYISKVAIKTQSRFKVPIHPSITSMLNYAPKLSVQVFNRYLKSLGESLGWNELVKHQVDTDNFKMKPFYKMLHSSVGRHTFATRALMSGVPHNIIMGWCGWKSITMLFYYVERINLQSADWMSRIE